jgi:hypothetical protein
VPARDYPHLESALRLDYGGRVFGAHVAMLGQLLGPWHAVRSVTVTCTRCGATAEDQETGYEPYFASIEAARRQLAGYGWRVLPGPGAEQVLCEDCANKDDCERLGHQPVVTGGVRMDDGSVLGPSTWCERCGDLLAHAPGTPAPDGYPVPRRARVVLRWDAAALPGGQDLADAFARVMDRICDDAVAARWDNWDGPQDGRPSPAAEPGAAADETAALALIDAGNRLLETLRAATT